MPAAVEELHLVGGNAALDFANTVGSHSSDHPHDYIHTFEELLDWCARAGVLTPEQGRVLRKKAAAEPARAAEALKQAGRLRQTIYRLFMAVARGEPTLRAELDRFNSFVEGAFGHARVAYTGGAFGLDFDPAGRLDGMLAAIAWSAIELLRSSEIGRVKACGKDTCGWLFVDRSKNKSRRWCEMSDCGNGEKARRFQSRKKGHAGAQEQRSGRRRARRRPVEARGLAAEAHKAAVEDAGAAAEDRGVAVEED